MKLNKYISLAALAVAFTACQDDMQESGKQRDAIYTLSGTMDHGSAMSRAQIDLDNTDTSKEVFMWNDDDAFTLFQKKNEQWNMHEFTISTEYKESGSGDKKTATFATTHPVQAGDYVAFYPVNSLGEVNELVSFKLDQELSFSEGVDPKVVWSEYLQKNMHMMASGKLSGTATNTVTFQHLMSLARITYTNQTGEDQPIAAIGLGGSEDASIGYIPEPYITLMDSEYKLGSSWSISYYEMQVNGLTIPAGESFDFYVLFAPVTFAESGDFHINVKHGESNFKTAELPTATIAEANHGYLGFEAGKRYWFHITETEEEMVWSKDYVECVTIQNAELSAALLGILGDEVVKLNHNNYAVIAKENADTITQLVINPDPEENAYSIKSLSGIENFPNLVELVCIESGLKTCDFSQNPALETVFIPDNNMTELDFSKNPKLRRLVCYNNESLTDVNVADCQLLEYINVDHTALAELELYDPSKISDLGYSYTELSLDLSEFTGLRFLSCGAMGLTTLNLTSETKAQLRTLDCYGNKLTALNLKEYPELRTLYCGNNQISELVPSYSPNLSTLECNANLLTTLDVSKLEKLTRLVCGNQQKGTMKLTLNEAQKKNWDSQWSNWKYNQGVTLAGSGDDGTGGEGPQMGILTGETISFTNEAFHDALFVLWGKNYVGLDAKGNRVISKSKAETVTQINFIKNASAEAAAITTLAGIEKFPKLTEFLINESNLSVADFSKNTLMNHVYIFKGKLTSLNVKGLSNLTKLNVNANTRLGNVDLTGCVRLQYVEFGDNAAMTELVIPDLSILKSLNVIGTNISTLNLSSSKVLVDLMVGNSLKNLTLPTSAPSLRVLNMNGVKMQMLDVSRFSSLERLDCDNCGLTSLIVGNGLKHLSCRNNQLTSLDIFNCTLLEYLDSQLNFIKVLTIPNAPNLETLYCGRQGSDPYDKPATVHVTLPDCLLDKWCGQEGWENMGGNLGAVLQEPEDNSEGNTGGEDFTIEEIY